ncbi:Plug domain-containing protein [Flavobacterium sp. ARAG 55.4]|uniref:Plug domain-containing protein n=1 Tax=Flavobacterium sp. ARAG 55.4 TaxID=3451357 RepID=UPI003F45EFF8
MIQNKKTLCFLLFLLSIVSFNAQDKKTIPDIEKIYLHTDRSTYFVGEDLWYKAYNVRASNNLLFDNSNILYVELISDDSKMIARNKTNLEMGLGHGDFQLVDSVGVKPGIYQLRAYTNWNRNFGEEFVFKKDIEIIDVFEEHSQSQSKHTISENQTKNIRKKTQSNFKVDFFPEGGSLLENVASFVGFKAVDSNGKPIEIKGELLDSNNELVTAFESVHDGMGKFQMVPMEGKTYYAKIKTLSGEELKTELPNVFQQGYLISFRTIKGKNIISITTNEITLSQNSNAFLTVVCKAKGIPYLETTQTLTETSLSFELPKDKTPNGISQITLFDNTNKPQSERLIYITKEHDLDVQLLTDSNTYEPNEKTIVYVSTVSKDGTPKSASFSLSVTDTNGVEEDNFESNICSYFLMESDIRGKIHHPGYYFDNNNPKRLDHLDNLLLTQGWRDFVWKTTPKVNEKNLFKPEKGITISGRVKEVFSDKPLINNNLTLALMNKKNSIFLSAITDSMGRFEFKNLMFFDKTNMYLNSVNEKGKFRGEMVLDSIERAPIPVRLKKELFLLPETKQITENVLNKFTAFGVKPENVLNEVVVKSKNKYWQPVYYKNPFSTYTPDIVTKTLVSIWDVLEIVPGIWVKDRFDRDLRVVGEKDVPSILVNGFGVYNYDLDYILPNEIVKIEVVRELGVPIISIFINRNWNDKPKKVPVYSVKQEIEGFSTARIFYSPDPEKPNPMSDKNAAVRNTIYWNPFVHPDGTGETSIDYYNTNVETKLKVALEGITAHGIPVVKTTYYSIKK